MNVLSKRGEPSTLFEKIFFSTFLLIGLGWTTIQINDQYQRNKVFEATSKSTYERCTKNAIFPDHIFFDINRAKIYDCIALTRDSEFTQAAQEYIQKYGKVIFTP